MTALLKRNEFEIWDKENNKKNKKKSINEGLPF